MGQTYPSIVIDLPVESVGDAICNSHDLSWTLRVVTRVKVQENAEGGTLVEWSSSWE